MGEDTLLTMPSNVSPIFTRRDFIKLSGLGMLGALIPPSLPERENPNYTPQIKAIVFQGRVIDPSIKVYMRPSFFSQQVSTYWQNSVVPIRGATVGDDVLSPNRVWYKVGEVGFVHSACIQLVITTLNVPVDNIPIGGALAEVTVPFTDSYIKPRHHSSIAYRFYYSSTHWVSDLVVNDRSEPWYRVWDDRLEKSHYVPARHLRLISKAELTPISPYVPFFAKKLVVSIQSQIVTAYEWDRPVFMAQVSTGDELANPKWATPRGNYEVYYKRPSRHMMEGDITSLGYDLPGVPWVSYFQEDGYALHGVYWHNDFGNPRSHGCINLSPQNARWIYRWTLPEALPDQPLVFENHGTRLEII
jgi:hypothetical protein